MADSRGQLVDMEHAPSQWLVDSVLRKIRRTSYLRLRDPSSSPANTQAGSMLPKFRQINDHREAYTTSPQEQTQNHRHA